MHFSQVNYDLFFLSIMWNHQVSLIMASTMMAYMNVLVMGSLFLSVSEIYDSQSHSQSGHSFLP